MRMKRIYLLALLLFLFTLCGCKETKDMTQDTGDTLVVANDQTIAFTDNGYYYVSDYSIFFMNTSGDVKEIYNDENTWVYSLFTYQDSLYAVVSRNANNSSDNGCCFYVWKNGTGKPEILFETENRVWSCFLQGNVLLYITHEPIGIVVDEDKVVYDYNRNEVHQYNLKTGQDKLIVSLEGSENHITNYLQFAGGACLIDGTPILVETYSPVDEDAKTNFCDTTYSVFYKFYKEQLVPLMSVPFTYECIDTYIYADTIWMTYCSESKEDENGLRRYRLAKMDQKGENQQDILEVTYDIHFMEEGAYTCSSGEKFKRLYYDFKTETLSASKLELPEEYNIKAVDVEKDLLAYDTTDYSKYGEGAVITEDPVTYCIGKLSDYMSEHFEKYTGDMEDCVTIYGEMTK